ncbi:uncharacterized protein LOC114516893 [Dendronephthya gigantea]|uniref:uncharacterized protein LOC114516893 n=1 Tax=Dendronephthya gigantea TaxID=151771 RepID=UPI00106B6C01|nr:uncharacterized protein LOC114516893 [Dendronephthya gigantea]
MVTAENDKLRQDIAILLERMEIVENDNKELREMVESVNKKNQDLDDEMKSLRELLEAKKRLQLGQIAWELEEKIWDYVLPNQKKGSTAYLKSMKHLLESEDLSLEEKEEGKRKWEELKRKLKWNEKRHKHALWLLKQIRFNLAHPDVTVEMARKLIKEGSYVAEIEKKSCEEIIDMIVTLENIE